MRLFPIHVLEFFFVTPALRSKVRLCSVAEVMQNWPSINSLPPPWGLVDRYFLVVFP